MKKLLTTIALLVIAVSCIAQTTLTLTDMNPNDGRIEAYYSNVNVDVTRYHVTWTNENDGSWGTLFSDTTFTFIGGLSSGTYSVVVQAMSSENAFIDDAVTKEIDVVNPAIPVAPIPLLTLNDDYTIHVAWSTVAGVNHYKVEWSNDPYFFFGDVHSKIAAGSQESMNVSTDNGEWYFRMYAYNADGDVGEPNYTPPSVIVDKPLVSHLYIPWFTESERWGTMIYVSLPDTAHSATFTIRASLPYPSTISVQNTVTVNDIIGHEGYAYAFSPLDLFQGMIDRGSIEIISKTVGVKATVEIKAKNGELADTYNAVDIRDTGNSYEFPAIILSKPNDTGSNQIMALALRNISEFTNHVNYELLLTDGDTGKSLLTTYHQLNIPANSCGAWVVPAIAGHPYVLCRIKIYSVDHEKFVVVASNQTENPTICMSASWIEPKKIK